MKVVCFLSKSSFPNSKKYFFHNVLLPYNVFFLHNGFFAPLRFFFGKGFPWFSVLEQNIDDKAKNETKEEVEKAKKIAQESAMEAAAKHHSPS